MPGVHALLSPSAAHRWMNCTAAPRLEAKEPESESEFAAEGTLAHAYCAAKLKDFLGLPTDEEREEITNLNEQFHSGEMDEYTDIYKTIVLEKFNAARQQTRDAKLLVETVLDFSHYIPEAFGTADAIIIADGTMEVIDFKYGKGVRVSAVQNPQMMIYALGAVEKFSFEYDIKNVRMTIVQPRIDNLSEFTMTVAEMYVWSVEQLKPKAAEAFEGGEQKPGEWCRFCKIKSKCKALANQAVQTAEDFPDPKLVSKADMESIILPRIETIKTWLSGIEEFALQQALSGVDYAGYKVVAGRSVRKITDTQGAINALSQAGFDETAIFKPKELRGIGDLEKLVGKKRFGELCKDYIEKPQGKPTLVPEDDKRPAYDAASEDFKGISD